MRKRTWAALIGSVAAALTAVCAATGCADMGYLWQSAGGHLDLLKAARPVGEVIADPATPADLRQRLELSQRIREFAVTELKLPDNDSYRRYADVGRAAVVWNVIAAPQLSLTLKTWCFPVTGCIGYRGYFDQKEAEALASQLRGEGYEVSVYGVPAYSTLGKIPGRYFADPLLSTFIRYNDGELARMVFHELSHQVAFANGDTMFNESFATAVERIGAQRWLQQHADPRIRSDYEQFNGRRNDFRELVLRYRAEFETLYRSERPDDDKRRGKAELLQRLRDDYAVMKRERWAGYAGYDGWFERVNNAVLGGFASYHQLTADFERLFERQGGDFERFYAEVRRLAALPKEERDRALQQP